jgi:hypothetical protein
VAAALPSGKGYRAPFSNCCRRRTNGRGLQNLEAVTNLYLQRFSGGLGPGRFLRPGSQLSLRRCRAAAEKRLRRNHCRRCKPVLPVPRRQRQRQAKQIQGSPPSSRVQRSIHLVPTVAAYKLQQAKLLSSRSRPLAEGSLFLCLRYAASF